MKSLDPFSAQKEAAFTQSLPAITALASYILDMTTDKDANSDKTDQFSALFHVCFLKHLICVSFHTVAIKF